MRHLRGFYSALLLEGVYVKEKRSHKVTYVEDPLQNSRHSDRNCDYIVSILASFRLDTANVITEFWENGSQERSTGRE